MKGRLGAALLALVLGLSVFGVEPAHAAPYRVGYAVDMPQGRETIGTLDVRPGSQGNRVLCTTPGQKDPASLPAANSREGAVVAYLLNRWVNTLENDRAAALWYAVNQRITESDAGRDALWARFEATLPAEAVRAKTLAAEMVAEANRHVGPFTIPIDLTGSLTTQSGTVEGVGIKTGSGDWYPGVELTVTLAGPAVFTSTGTSTAKVISTAAAQSLPWKVTGPGKISASALSAKVLPAPTYAYYPSTGPLVQSMVSSSSGFVAATGRDPILFDTTTTPKLESTVGTVYLRPGQVLQDTISVTGGIAGVVVPVTAQVFGPLTAAPKESSVAPAGTPLFETVTGSVALDATGKGSVGLKTSKPASAAGWYVWQESSAAVGSLLAATSTFGRVSETSAVWRPQITSQVSASLASAGTKLTDEVQIRGILPVAGTPVPKMILTGEARYLPADPKLKGAAACQNRDWTGAKTLAKIPTTSVTGNVILKGLGETTPTEAGCVSYGYTLTATDAAGKQLWVERHPFGDPSQTAIVVKPAFVTKAVITDDGHLVDEITVTGTVGQSALLTPTIFGQPAKMVGDHLVCGTDWGKAPVVKQLADITVTGDGVYRSQPYPLPKANQGFSFGAQMRFTDRALASATVTEAPGLPAETLCYMGISVGGRIDSGLSSKVPNGLLLLLGTGLLTLAATVATRRRVMA